MIYKAITIDIECTFQLNKEVVQLSIRLASV